jgi:hypothetical protein
VTVRVDTLVSSNGGASFSYVKAGVQPQTVHTPAANISAGGALVAGTAGGRVYATWPDCRFEPDCSANDLVIMSSTDGIRWTTPHSIDQTRSGNDYIIEGFGTATGGDLALTYYYYQERACTATACDLQVAFTDSQDGGARWNPPMALAGPINTSWLSLAGGMPNVGPFVGTVFSQNTAVAIFPVAAAPSGGLLHEDMYAAVL